MTTDEGQSAARVIAEGRATLGIEFGSTRIKACLIGPDFQVLAVGAHEWENEFVDGRWTYSLDAVWAGLQCAYADLADSVQRQYGLRPTKLAAIGISAMMHGYLAVDDGGELLVPFRTWRNTSTGPAAAELTEALDFNVPLRWSIAHLYQAVLDEEPHVARLDKLMTLAAYVHWRLTGRFVAGSGDASGMFPIDAVTGGFDEGRLAIAGELISRRMPDLDLAALLPEVLPAGSDAGVLTDEGAALLDPSGVLQPGIRLCPPEGDAGTGMVATNSVSVRTGNVSVGTSVFAMIVLEHDLAAVHPELDVVTTPAGAPVAMVHCNNGASELAAWAGVFGQFAERVGAPADSDAVFGALLGAAAQGEADGGGLLAYNFLSGEPIAGLDAGRPLVVRTPESHFTLANFMRSQLYSVFATLSLGMEVLAGEGVRVDRMLAHGGVFRTADIAQRALAAALGVPVAVERSAGEGGAWGIALLAAYLDEADELSLGEFLDRRVFTGDSFSEAAPDPAEQSGFRAFLESFRAGLAIERAAVQASARPVEKENRE
ncbi:xylulokinase [Gryllotalpicola protaetiae]|uniref:ATPase n=1 Tax=Gryllotalpicola protaetiae TaxID=2419771 RepID=A0A387BJT1_9MICO|nr:FGGY-family carbohydrate kinase [Gryllotalpicola protaetiae]AYG04103.1 ATPase [Gryllotalpicola protaetiae]